MIFGYYLARKSIDDREMANKSGALENKLATAEALNKNLSQSLASASAELAKVKGSSSTVSDGNNQSISDLILDKSGSAALLQFTGKAGVSLISVYESSNTSSKKLVCPVSKSF